MSKEQKDIQPEHTSAKGMSSYRSIFKATTLFGGVQVYQIFISVLRSKIIALILGPSGMGIAGLYNSAVSLIKSMSSMGLSSSAVRDVSEANASADQQQINTTITCLRRLVWFTGLLGMALVMIGAPLLSKSTFGNYEYIFPFILLSVTLLIDQLTVGQKVILQGTRRLKYLARSSAIGATLGLIVTVPLYYFFGVDGIVPTLVIVSFVSYFLVRHFAKKVPFSQVKMSFKETIHHGSIMLKMGIAMSVNGLLLSGSAYIIRIFIMRYGGMEAVGLMTAGSAILTTYVGMIFSAVSTDYYPRLAAVNKDNEKCRSLINQEGEIGSLILAPCLILCVLFMPIIIRILYTEDFITASEYVLWASLGMLFKMASWAIAFIFIAKSSMKTFLTNEITSMVYHLILSIAGYYLWGLKGLGCAFSLNYIIYTIQVYCVAHVKYDYKPSLEYVKTFIINFVLVSVTIAVVILLDGIHSRVIGVVLMVISILYSLYGLNKRMNLKALINDKLTKWKKTK